MGCKICGKCILQCCFDEIFSMSSKCVLCLLCLTLPFYVLTCKPRLTNCTFDIYLVLYFKGNKIGAMATFFVCAAISFDTQPLIGSNISIFRVS